MKTGNSCQKRAFLTLFGGMVIFCLCGFHSCNMETELYGSSLVQLTNGWKTAAIGMISIKRWFWLIRCVVGWFRVMISAKNMRAAWFGMVLNGKSIITY